MKVLSLHDITFCYETGKKILDGLSLELEKGTVTAIFGKSGCGKSTLARIACGVIPNSIEGILTGTVNVLGEDIANKPISETAHKISMVFQEPASQLFAPAVIDEVAFAPENLCLDEQAINERVIQCLETVGMEKFIEYPPHKLSGGQQQLIALASVLALDPEIIILDEVTSQIDEEGKLRIRQAIQKLKEQGKTILMIEHGTDNNELFDKVYVLKEGKLYISTTI